MSSGRWWRTGRPGVHLLTSCCEKHQRPGEAGSSQFWRLSPNCCVAGPRCPWGGVLLPPAAVGSSRHPRACGRIGPISASVISYKDVHHWSKALSQPCLSEPSLVWQPPQHPLPDPPLWPSKGTSATGPGQLRGLASSQTCLPVCPLPSSPLQVPHALGLAIWASADRCLRVRWLS